MGILATHMFAYVLLAVALYAPSVIAAEIQEFSAEYEIYYGNIHLGKANFHLSHSKENGYRLDFTSHLSFLIFWDKRVASSEFVHEDQRLFPSYYRHDRKGTGRDYLEELVFDRPNSRILATYQKENKVIDYEQDIIDGLTMQLQFMLDLQRGVQRPQYRIVDFNKLKEYEFSFVREETVNLANVAYDSVMFRVVRDHERRETQIWFSPERNFLPIKMAHFSKGKKKFNTHLVDYIEFDSSGNSLNRR